MDQPHEASPPRSPAVRPPERAEHAPTPEELARELELVRRATAGDPDALSTVVERLTCVPRMLSVVNARHGSPLGPHDLEDVTQDVLIRIWQKLGTFAGHTTLEFWAHKFCFLEFMNKVRSRSRRSQIVNKRIENEDPSAPTEDEPLVDPVVLERALGQLEASFQEVIRQKAFEKRSFEEIGEMLGIPPNTAKSRYYRGITELRRRLSGGGGNG